jgi:hypothetical protein
MNVGSCKLIVAVVLFSMACFGSPQIGVEIRICFINL